MGDEPGEAAASQLWGLEWARGAAWIPSWESGRRASQLSLGSRPPSYLWGPAGPAGQGGGHLPGGGQSLYLFLSPPPCCLSFSNNAWDPAHLLCYLPPPFPLSVSLSLTPSVSPWVPGSCLSGPGSPRPGAGLCKCGISRVSSAGLPAWLTFNLIRGGASAEPLIKAGRQLGECQGGLGPRG